MPQFQRAELRFVATALALVQGLPGGMGRHLFGGLEQLLEHLTARMLPELGVVIVEQHLDADGALDERQLLVQQTAGENPQILRQRRLPFFLQLGLLPFIAPDTAPEIQPASAAISSVAAANRLTESVMTGSGAVALLVFLLAAARARVVASDVLQRITHRLVAMIAMRTVNVVMVMVVIVVAVGTMHMGLVTHLGTTPE